jgi:hypothetical protein
VSPNESGFVQMMQTLDARRQAAYRRLALTILGLDIVTLVQTLPVTRERVELTEVHGRPRQVA